MLYTTISVIAGVSIVVAHTSYQFLLRILKSWGLPATDRLPGMGFGQNLKTYIREVKQRDDSYARCFWWLVSSLVVNVCILLIVIVHAVLRTRAL